ncbi:hypothetical protein [Halalkalibacter oceani]|uniref:hypothetical protein n=1 Tax=Halalkalibacter oceani TaxID=1653776 RepID=UPI003398B40F
MLVTAFNYFILNDLSIDIKDYNLASLAGLTVIFLGVGIPIGQLIYQLYFFSLWIYRTFIFKIIYFIFGLRLLSKRKKIQQALIFLDLVDKDGYFELEFQWHNSLSNLENKEKMEYLSQRYRHLLNRVHELGALLTSLVISSSIQIAIYQSNSIVAIENSIHVLLALTICSLVNFLYFDANLNFFRKRVLNESIS